MALYILSCVELAIDSPCCPDCISNPQDRTIVYPASVYSLIAPDQSMGIKASVCCHHIHIARSIRRGWWVNELMRRQGRYVQSDIMKLVAVADDKDLYYKTWAEVHQTVRDREVSGLKLVASNKPAPDRPKRKESGKCPGCGGWWDQVVCDGCGHIGG